MSDESKTIKIDITASATGMDAGVSQAETKMAALEKSTSKLASQYSGLNQSVQQHGAAVQTTEGSVRKLLDRYDPLGAKLRQLQEDFKQLDRAAAGGKIAGRDDARVDQVYANMQREIKGASAAADAFALSSGKAALTSGQLRMATQQLPMQFTDIWVSLAAGQSPMMVMLQQGTQIKDSFGGVGNAAKAMGKYIMGLVNPYTLAAAAVAGAGYAWYRYAVDAESAAEKSITAADKILASMREIDEVYLLSRERSKLAGQISFRWLDYDENQLQRLDEDGQKLVAKIKEIDKKIQSEKERSNREWDALYATDTERKAAELKKEKQLYDEQLVMFKGQSEKLLVIERQHQQKIAAINKSFEKKATKSGSADDRTESEKAFADAWVETQKLLQNVDPQAKANAEWERMIYLQTTLGDQFPMTAEQMGAAYAKMMSATEKTTDKMSDSWKTFADNTQRTLSDVLYNGMNGEFNNIEEMFKQMLFRMAANAAAARLTESLFGTGKGGNDGLIGAALTAMFSTNHEGGIAGLEATSSKAVNPAVFNGAPRFHTGGVAGDEIPIIAKRGEGIFTPEQMKNLSPAGGGGSIVINDNSVINFDASADRAQMLSEASQLIDAKQARLVDTLRRERAIA